MERERSAMYLGLALLAAGIVVLVFVLTTVLSLAANPGPFIERQLGGPQETPPQAMFTWMADGLNATFTDVSSGTGDATIERWSWEFGDGGRSSQRNPSHQYASDGDYTVLLIVTDSNDRQATAVATIGVSMGNPGGGASEMSPNLDFGFDRILFPVAVVLLTFGMYVVSFLVGASLVKAGWNLIRPRPETIRIRLRPQQFEHGATAEVVPPLPPPGQPLPPPTPPSPPPPTT